MSRTLLVASGILLSGILFPKLNFTQEKTGATESKITPDDVAKKNPVPPTAESLAGARKIFGYNCTMCDEKTATWRNCSQTFSALPPDMKLELRDWRDPAALEK